MSHAGETRGPLVTVLVPTFNRRATLREALASLVAQTYTHFEAFVINDGGEPVRDIVDAFADPRLALIDRRENRGKAASLNEALVRARGTYVAYLDDDDLFYPRHLQRLVETLEADASCGVAYTDLYKVHCRVLPDGSRQALGKVVNVCRDFDRFFLCYFNHTLHVSLMHRRDLVDRTGPYDESLGILIDWDMTRRLAFFTDFLHVPEVTGEFYAPVADSDRISEKGRADRQAFIATTLKIRTARPPKPWPRMPDLSIVALPDGPEAAGAMVRDIYAWTFMPYQVLLPMPEAALVRLRIRMPNFVPVATADGATRETRLAAALERGEGDYVAVVPPGTTFQMLWVEDALHAATRGDGRTAFALPGPKAVAPAFVLPTARWRACCAVPPAGRWRTRSPPPASRFVSRGRPSSPSSSTGPSRRPNAWRRTAPGNGPPTPTATSPTVSATPTGCASGGPEPCTRRAARARRSTSAATSTAGPPLAR